MAVGDVVCTHALGRFIGWAEQANVSAAGEAMLVVLFKSAGLPSDTTLMACKFLSDAVAAGAVEGDFTFSGSRRKTVSGSSVVVTNNTGTRVSSFSLPTQVWNAAGGALNNDLGKVGVFMRFGAGDADSAIRCISFHKYVGSTTGLNLEAVIGTVASDTFTPSV